MEGEVVLMFHLYHKERDEWFTVYHVLSTEDAVMFLVYIDGKWLYLPCEEFVEDEC